MRTDTIQETSSASGCSAPQSVCRLLKERQSLVRGREAVLVSLLLLILLVVLLVGAVPAWPYNRSWGYYPSGGVGLLLLILIILLLTGRL